MNRYCPSLLALLLLLPAAPLGARQADRDQPIDVAADSVNAVLDDTGESVLSGNVRITQGSLVIEADKATISRRAGAMSQAVLVGAPATVAQILDNGGQMRARARTVDYDVSGQVLLLTGAVLIEQPEGTVRGERVRYDMRSGRMEGGSPGSRVEMRLEPKPATSPAD